MRRLQSWLESNLRVILLLLLTGGYALIAAELLITGHTDGIQLVGVGASIVGALLALSAVILGQAMRNWVALVLLLLAVTGVMGTLQHSEAANEAEALLRDRPALTQTVALRAQEEEAESTPPPLAPLSLSGLSLMSALVIWGMPDKRLV